MKKLTPWSAMFCDNKLTLSEDRVRIGSFAFFGKLAQESVHVEGECEVGSFSFAFMRKKATVHLGDLCRMGARALALSGVDDIQYHSIKSIARLHPKAFEGACKRLFKHRDGDTYIGKSAIGERTYDILLKAAKQTVNLHPDPTTRFLFHGALRHCKSLSTIELPEGLEEIGIGVFHPKLSYTKYEGGLYLGNKKNPHLVLVRAKDHTITECTVHQDTKYIAQDAFWGCKQLKRIVILARGVRISEDAFKDSRKIVSYEGPLKPFVAMGKRRLEDAVITEGKCLSEYTIDGAPELYRLVLPEEMASIATKAVCRCPKLFELVIPLAVRGISPRAFYACPNLALICEAKEPPEGFSPSFAKGVRAVRWDGQGSISVGYLVDPSSQTASVHSYEPEAGEQEIFIPALRHGNAVREIRNGTFAENKNLKKVKISATALEIDIEAFAHAEALCELVCDGAIKTVGIRAFADCPSLERIESAEKIDSIEPYAFDGCVSFREIVTPWIRSIGRYAFRACRALTEPIFPYGEKVIREGTFCDCESIRTLKIPEGIEVIESGAFRGCTSLCELTLPSSLRHIGAEAFMGCTALREVSLCAKIEFIGERAFMGCTSLSRVGGAGFVKQISAEAFRGCTSLKRLDFFLKIERIAKRAFMGCSSLSSLDLYGSLHTMDDECFAECTALKSVEISSNIKYIGKSIFRGCSSLVSCSFTKSHTRVPEGMFENCGFKSLQLPLNIQVIGRRAFAECHELTQLLIPSTVKRVEPYAFHKCGNLTRLEIASGVETVAEYAFAMCGSLIGVRLGDTLRALTPYVFAWCGKLSEIEFGTSLERVCEGAFAYCNALLYLRLPAGLSTVEQKAFFYSRNLKVVWIPRSVARIGAEAFSGCERVEARCEIENKPNGWASGWISEKCDVSYGVTE